MVNVEEILRLSAEEKLRLVETIWNSIDQDSVAHLTLEHHCELDKRLDLIEAGKETFTDWAEVKKQLFK